MTRICTPASPGTDPSPTGEVSVPPPVSFDDVASPPPSGLAPVESSPLQPANPNAPTAMSAIVPSKATRGLEEVMRMTRGED